MHDLIGDVLLGLVVIGFLYAIFSDFGVRGWRKDGKLWWRK